MEEGDCLQVDGALAADIWTVGCIFIVSIWMKAVIDILARL
jgi:hypothetical protein